MSVDSFLDSIIASTASVPQSVVQKQDAAIPVFQKPPVVAPPVVPPSVPVTTALPALTTLPPLPLPLPLPVRVDVAVTIPADPARKAFIDLMAKFCAADGEAFEKVNFSWDQQRGRAVLFDEYTYTALFVASRELCSSYHYFTDFSCVCCHLPLQVIKTREEGNSSFSFLFDLDGAEGQYYRWRTYGTFV
jgi:hypothetical protein